MDSESVCTDPRSTARSRQHAALRKAVAAALIPTLLAGCREATSPPAPLAAATSTPEGRLQLVMSRLDHALRSAQPAADSGVTSTRRSKYGLHNPSDKDSRYTATVLIETTIALAAPPEGKAKIEPIGPESQAAVAEASAAVEPKVNTQQFKLAYENDRWELVDPPQEELPENSVERICFQYALSDG